MTLLRSETMFALVRNAAGLAHERTPVPLTAGAEVQIRVAFAGVCRTDLYVAQGRIAVQPPRVLGHEFSGVITSAPPGSGLEPGARVAVNPKLVCGRCTVCGDAQRSADQPPAPCLRAELLGVHRDGAFAEYVSVPRSAVLELPSSLSLLDASYLEPVAAALAVLRAPLRRGARGLIVGENRIAELIARVLAARGFGDVVRAATPPSGSFAFVIETLATGESLKACVEAVEPRGVIVLRSRPFSPVAIDVGACVAKEVTLHAVSYGSFHEALALLASGSLNIHELRAEPAPLSDFAAVFASADRPDARKHVFAVAPELER